MKLRVQSDSAMVVQLATRHSVVLMIFFGVLVSFMMRVNINLAIVAMVNHTATHGNNQVKMSPSEECQVTTTAVNLSGSAATESLASPGLDGQFVWNERVIGSILGSFYYGYILTQLPGGRLAELFNAKTVYGFSVVVTGFLTALTPLAAELGDWPALAALRALMGLALGVSYPASFVVLSAWVPPAEMNLLVIFTQGGGDLGNLFTLPLTSAIIGSFGWQWVFYIQAMIVFIWFLLWALLVESTPDHHKRISVEEREYINKAIGNRLSANPPPLPWRRMLSSRPVWAFFLSLFSANWCYYNLLNDMPQYVHDILGEDLTTNALLNSLPYAGLWLSSVLFGWVCDYLMLHKLLSVWTVRQLSSASTQLLTAITLTAVAMAGCHPAAVKTLLVITIILQGGGYGLDCQALDLAPNYAGTLSGLSNTFGAAPGFLAPLVVAELTVGNVTISSWRVVFLIGAAISLSGWLVFLFFSSVEIQEWNSGATPKEQHPLNRLSEDPSSDRISCCE